MNGSIHVKSPSLGGRLPLFDPISLLNIHLPPRIGNLPLFEPHFLPIIFSLKEWFAGLETYFFSHLQTFASGFNLNSQIPVSNSQLVFPTFEQFLTLRCGMAKASWGWNLVHRSPLRWQRTCWRLHSSFLRLKKYIIFPAIAVIWQDSESVLQGASSLPLLLL